MHEKRSRSVLVCALVAFVVAVPAAMGGAASERSANAAEAEGTGLWFVELEGTASTFRANAKAAGVGYRERLAFTKLWNGVSIQAGPAAMEDIRGLDGVKAVYPVLTFDLVPTAQIDPQLETALAMTGADVAQSELGFTGEGVKVAIMDTGIDYDHGDLGGDGVARENSTVFPTARVTHGWDFVGDAFDANPANPTYNPVPSPDPYPDDCNGHGTHVAGISGADGAVKGVAPNVTFGAYRVFGCEGSTTADIMLAAMERVLADGMDVLNMSIGLAFQNWPQYPTSVAADALADAGIVVISSAGNSGASGLYSTGSPESGRQVISVASFENSHVNALTFTVNPSGQQVPYLKLETTVDPPTSGTTPEVVYVGRGCPVEPPVVTVPDEYLADPSGKVALIDRGVCTFNGKYQRAVDAGAVAVVIANHLPGLFAGGAVVDRGVPGVGISLEDGNHIKAQLEAGETVTLTWTDERVNSVNPGGGLISSFSSWGMTAELDLKPDIGAPGGLIRSTYPLEAGGYAIVSGTSMAAPHVAGAAALLLEARPGLSSVEVRDILMNNAVPRPWVGNPALGFGEAVHRQGAGMLRIDRALTATAAVAPAKLPLSFLQPVTPDVNTRTLTIANSGPADVTYTPSFAPAVGTTANTMAPGITGNWPDVEFSASSVTVPSGGTATIDVTFDMSWASSAFDHQQYGGHVVLTPDGEGQALRVPMAGFRGNYLGIQVLVPTDEGYPWLTKLQDGEYVKQEDGAVYTMAGGDIPYVIAHFRHQSRRLELVLLDAATDEPVVKKGRTEYRPVVVEEDYLSRNSIPTAFFAYAWDGRIDQVNPNGKVVRRAMPAGNYKLQLRVLKALGDASNPAHWETWTSPMFRAR